MAPPPRGNNNWPLLGSSLPPALEALVEDTQDRELRSAKQLIDALRSVLHHSFWDESDTDEDGSSASTRRGEFSSTQSVINPMLTLM